MKTQTMLCLTILMFVIGFAGCKPNAPVTSANNAPDAVPSETPMADKSQQGNAMSKGIPMTNSVPGVASVPTTPMKKGSAEAPANIPALLEVSVPAPNFDSIDLAGQTVNSAGFKDKVVVLDFWATWCGPCLASLPHTQEVAARYKDQNVVVLAVCTSDARDKFEAWTKANQAKYPDIVFTCDPNERDSTTYEDRAASKLFGVRGIPSQFVVGRDGKIAAVVVGAPKDDVRLEAGLARAGVVVDPMLIALGEEQFKKGDN